MLRTIVRTVLFWLFVALFAAVLWQLLWPWSWWNTPSPAERDKQVMKTLVWDDACLKEDVPWVAAVGYNRWVALNRGRKANATIPMQEVYNHGMTLAAPSQDGRFFWRFKTIVNLYAIIKGEPQSVADANAAADAIIEKGPSAYSSKEKPELACAERMIRGCNTLWTWVNKTAMRAEMRLVHTSPSGSEYFCPK